jgi:hypothetical protein
MNKIYSSLAQVTKEYPFVKDVGDRTCRLGGFDLRQVITYELYSYLKDGKAQFAFRLIGRNPN